MKLNLTQEEKKALLAYLEAGEDCEKLSEKEWVMDLYQGEKPISLDLVFNGKSVFAVPGSIFSKYSKGTNKMIKEGCPPVTCAEDILFELGFEPEEAEENKNKEKEIIKNINENGKRIVKVLENGEANIEKLISETGLTAAALQAELAMLEVKGIIRRQPGQRYILVL